MLLVVTSYTNEQARDERTSVLLKGRDQVSLPFSIHLLLPFGHWKYAYLSAGGVVGPPFSTDQQ